MCRVDWCRWVTVSAVGVGVGILLSFLLPWCALAWLEAVALLLLGVLWFKRCG